MGVSSIGIIGAGNIGQAFARALARNKIEATISSSRGPNLLREVLGEIWPDDHHGDARGEVDLKTQGWQVRKSKVDGGCFEVCGTDLPGNRVEA